MNDIEPPAGLAGHRLASLLTPRSVAFVGASPKADTVGNGMIKGMLAAASRAASIPSIPIIRRSRACACYPGFADLPEPVDLAVLGVANARLEAAHARKRSRHRRRAPRSFCQLLSRGRQRCRR